MTGERDKPSHPAGALVAVALLLLLPALYVLGVGPAALVYETGNADWLEYVYWPLMALGEVCPPMESALEWYIELWVPH